MRAHIRDICNLITGSGWRWKSRDLPEGALYSCYLFTVLLDRLTVGNRSAVTTRKSIWGYLIQDFSKAMMTVNKLKSIRTLYNCCPKFRIKQTLGILFQNWFCVLLTKFNFITKLKLTQRWYTRILIMIAQSFYWKWMDQFAIIILRQNYYYFKGYFHEPIMTWVHHRFTKL